MTTSAGVAASPRTFNLKRQLRSWTFWVIVLVTAAVLAVLLLWPARFTGLALDPENPTPEGTKALAQVLGQEGIKVTIVRTIADAAELATDAEPTTLVITDYYRAAYYNSNSGMDEVINSYPDVVVLGALSMPDEMTQEFQVDYTSFETEVTFDAKCPSAVVGQARTISTANSQVFRLSPGSVSNEARMCFVRDGVGLLAHTRLASGTNIDVVADEMAFTNGAILRSDAAALALTLMGRHPHLVWLSLDPDSVYDDEEEEENAAPEGQAFLPPWFDSFRGLLVWSGLVAMMWRGRRLGRLVIEPLPVVVKAIETTLARGRVYHKTHATERSLLALQQATARRLAQRLSLPANAPLAQVSDATAVAANRDPSQVWEMLSAPVHSEQEMVSRAQGLATLEEEVRLR